MNIKISNILEGLEKNKKESINEEISVDRFTRSNNNKHIFQYLFLNSQKRLLF